MTHLTPEEQAAVNFYRREAERHSNQANVMADLDCLVSAEEYAILAKRYALAADAIEQRAALTLSLPQAAKLAAAEKRVAELEADADRLNEKGHSQWWMSRSERLSLLENPFRAKNIAICLASAFRQGTRAAIAAQRQKVGE